MALEAGPLMDLVKEAKVWGRARRTWRPCHFPVQLESHVSYMELESQRTAYNLNVVMSILGSFYGVSVSKRKTTHLTTWTACPAICSVQGKFVMI
eukprot:366458-Chlamydomonas_euryale.AAC.16